MARILYQTLQNKGNYDEVERDGPFRCPALDAWLGPGYYFWDTFIENAHWWGGKGYVQNYIICEARYDFDMAYCFDLQGNTEHLNDFTAICKEMKESGKYGDEIVVSDVIALLRKVVKEFNYKAIRASSLETRRYDDEYSLTIKYKKNNKWKNYNQRLDMQPLIQICIFEKGTFPLQNFKIVYPENI